MHYELWSFSGQDDSPSRCPSRCSSRFTPFEAVTVISKLNKRVCREVEEQRKFLTEESRERWWKLDEWELDLFRIHPLFRAVCVVVEGYNFPLHERGLSAMDVQIIRTGEESGLSAPVHLETFLGSASVKKFAGEDDQVREIAYTTLEKAFWILDALEKREAAALPRLCGVPDGNFQRQHLERLSKEARRLGWGEEDFDVGLPVSKGVDRSVFPHGLDRGDATFDQLMIYRSRWLHKNLRRHVLGSFKIRHFSLAEQPTEDAAPWCQM